MKKTILLILFITLLSCLYAKTWIREYTYQASEADSKLTSRAISLEQVQRLLLQEIGVYIHASVLSGEIETSGELKELTSKQIEIISAGITETKILEENWNGETYYIKAEITADENDVLEKLDKVFADKEKTRQLEESRRKTDEALAEIDRLKQQLAQSKDEDEKLHIQKTYNQSSNQLTVEEWFQKGYRASEMEEYDRAIEYYQQVIAIYPENAEAYNNMGAAYNDKGDYDRAIANYQKAIAIDPENATRYYNLGVTYKDKGDYDRAIASYQKAIAINPEFADAYFNLGAAYYDKGDYDRAIANYQKAIAIDPEDASTYYNLGITYAYKKRDFDRAIPNYQKAIAIDPEYVAAYYDLGAAYSVKGDFDRAIANIHRAIAIDPENAFAYYNLGITNYFKGLNTLAGDNLYQAGIKFLKQNNRQEVLRTIDLMKIVVPDSPLIKKLQDKLYE